GRDDDRLAPAPLHHHGRAAVDPLGAGSADPNRSHVFVCDLLRALPPLEPKRPREQLELARRGLARSLSPDHSVARLHWRIVTVAGWSRIPPDPHAHCGKAAPEAETSRLPRRRETARIYVMARKSFTEDEARAVGEQIGIDWVAAPFDVDQFRRGMDIEL